MISSRIVTDEVVVSSPIVSTMFNDLTLKSVPRAKVIVSEYPIPSFNVVEKEYPLSVAKPASNNAVEGSKPSGISTLGKSMSSVPSSPISLSSSITAPK